MGVLEPTRQFVTVHSDSRQWGAFERRPGDIVISTPPKSGTTWMQGIVAAILWPDGDEPGVPFDMSPWLDMRASQERGVPGELAAQTHRRFIKTHSPANAIPIDDDCRYITVHRDLRDATVSWANHRRAMHAEIVQELNDSAVVDGIDRLDPVWNGDVDGLIDELVSDFGIDDHLRSWWELRSRPNVLFVHYSDMLADLEAEMRRIASFLEQPVPEAAWPAVVDRCTIASMRAAARQSESMAFVFDGGADSFFNQGTNGRWRQQLTDTQADRLDQMMSSLPEDAATWLRHGSTKLGERP